MLCDCSTRLPRALGMSGLAHALRLLANLAFEGDNLQVPHMRDSETEASESEPRKHIRSHRRRNLCS